MPDVDEWYRKLGSLRTGRGNAPHKPLLLLTIIDLAEEGLLTPQLALSPELTYRFLLYAHVTAERWPTKVDIRLPFYHLKGDSVWNTLDETGRPTEDRSRAKSVLFVPGFFDALSDPSFRQRARRLLIESYFTPAERVTLYSALKMPIPDQDILNEDAKAAEQQKKAGRELRFRVQVVGAYAYTCAMTGYRLTTTSGKSIVDAAHIHQFASGRNNDVDNGIALCKNAHWAFDEGLWSVTDDYRIIVASDKFTEAGPLTPLLCECAGRELRRPDDRRCWPNPTYMAWHRQHHHFA